MSTPRTLIKHYPPADLLAAAELVRFDLERKLDLWALGEDIHTVSGDRREELIKAGRWCEEVQYSAYDNALLVRGADDQLELSDAHLRWLWTRGFSECVLYHKDGRKSTYRKEEKAHGRKNAA